MKRVSFETAKALKEAGYPQRFISSFGWYNEEEKLFDSSIDVPMYEKDDECVAPTYLKVWLWLWRKKKIEITFLHNATSGLCGHIVIANKFKDIVYANSSNPEEAIEKAIEYLVTNNLIK